MSYYEQKRTIDLLRRFTAEGERKRLKTLTPMRINGRYPDGTLKLRVLKGECVERGNVAPGYEGQIVEIAPGPPLNISGAAGVAMSMVGRTGATMNLEAVDPHFYLAGVSYTVTVTGFGFLPVFAMEYADPRPGAAPGEIDPDMTITAIRYIDENTAEVDVTRASTAEPIDVETASVYYDNVGAPP